MPVRALDCANVPKFSNPGERGQDEEEKTQTFQVKDDNPGVECGGALDDTSTTGVRWHGGE